MFTKSGTVLSSLQVIDSISRPTNPRRSWLEAKEAHLWSWLCSILTNALLLSSLTSSTLVYTAAFKNYCTTVNHWVRCYLFLRYVSLHKLGGGMHIYYNFRVLIVPFFHYQIVLAHINITYLPTTNSYYFTLFICNLTFKGTAFHRWSQSPILPIHFPAFLPHR